MNWESRRKSRHESGVTVELQTLLSVIFLSSLIGNFLVIAVVYRNVNKKMITTMNLFVVNMAASDLLTTVLVIPVDILELLQKASGQFIIVLQQDLCYAKLCF